MKPDQLNVNYELRQEANNILKNQFNSSSVNAHTPAVPAASSAVPPTTREPRERDRPNERGAESRQRRDRSRSPNSRY